MFLKYKEIKGEIKQLEFAWQLYYKVNIQANIIKSIQQQENEPQWPSVPSTPDK